MRTADKEYHWHTGFPYVVAKHSNCDGYAEGKVMIMKYPATSANGILITSD